MSNPEELRAQAARLIAQAEAGETQIGQQDLAGMTPQEINTAREAGRLDVLLGADPSTVDLAQRAKYDQLSATDVEQLYAARKYDLIETARTEGRINFTTNEEN